MPEQTLTQEFQSTANAFKADSDAVTLAMLLAKYSLLSRHKIADGREQDKLAVVLFDCGMARIRKVLDRQATDNRPWVDPDIAGEADRIFSRIISGAGANHVPLRGPEQLAEISLECLRVAEQMPQERFATSSGGIDRNSMKEFKDQLTALAEVGLAFADKFRDAIHNSSANVKTANEVTPAKPFVLKAPVPEKA
jgi:hypothetical protein